MRVKLAALTIAIVSFVLLPSSARADTFQYDFTTPSMSVNGITGTINIVFTLTATTLPTFGDVTSFTSETNPFGTISAFGWNSAASGSCLGGFELGMACTEIINTPPPGGGFGASVDGFAAGSFLNPGTFVGIGGSTMVITDLGAVGTPEPSSLLLLGCGLFGLVAIAKFRLRRIGAQ